MKTAAGVLPPIRHVAFDGDDDGVPLERARGTDFDRLAWVLQGMALLAHLDHVGWTLRDEGSAAWSRVRLGSDGQLRIDPLACCRARHPAQPQLLAADLLRQAFQVEGPVAGRGTARRIARRLLPRWSQTFIPQRADRIVAQILDQAAFLWRPTYGGTRLALGGGVLRADGSEQLWIVGPGGARRRLLSQAEDRLSLEALLASDRAYDLWFGVGTSRPDETPAELAEQGRWEHAAALASEQGPRRGAAALDPVRWLYWAGRPRDALERLGHRSSTEAKILRLVCQSELGVHQAVSKTLHRLEVETLSPVQMVEVADRAVRHFAKSKRHDRLRTWRRRVWDLIDASSTPAAVALSAHIVAAEASWDLQDAEAMAEHLDRVGEALDDPAVIEQLGERANLVRSRWHQAQTLRLGYAGKAIEHAAAALALGRRRAPRLRAGRLWSELAVARQTVDDLPGAERAARHAARILISCQGPIRDTLALYNLAEVRVRRGRLAGVDEAVDRSLNDNRRSANRLGEIHDVVLAARLELARGRYRTALQRLTAARHLPDVTDNEDLAILKARTYGWLGDSASAARALASVESATTGCLEAEEWPALWMSAGREEDAASAVRGTPWEPLWSALLDGIEPSAEAWQPLHDLEPYRAARVIYDVEHLRPGTAPPIWIVRAAATFRKVGIFELAGRLEARDGGPWRAFARFLNTSKPIAPALRELAREIGREDIRCTWTPRHGEAHVLLDGPGGGHRSTTALDEGQLILDSELADPMLDTLSAAICRWIGGRGDGSGGASPSIESETESTAGPSALDAAADGIIGRSGALLAALDRIDRFAPDGTLPVLIRGESGTGKESAARRVHRISRRGGRFVPVNCAAITDSLIQSELFGHARGAFTGADRARVGAFEAANHGTLFLDEIGDLPLESQAKLLRVLQEGEVQRVGETEARKIDVRVVTATHRDLSEMVGAGTFRQDLFYRLAVASVELPPLRERGDDIELLARHILQRTDASGLDTAAAEALHAHAWPGNIRELVNVLRVSARLADSGTIGLDHLGLPAAPAATRRPEGRIGLSGRAETDIVTDYHQAIEDFRRRLIAATLEQCNGNRAEAARHLGLTRQTLSYHVRKFGLM